MGVPIFQITVVLLVSIGIAIFLLPVPDSTFKTKPGEEWRDYSLLHKCTPKHVHQPKTVEEIVDIVKVAYQKGEKIRVVGAGFSMSPIALTSDHMINLDFLNKVVVINKEKKTITVEAGMRFKDLHEILAENSLSMPNVGSVSEYSVGGAISTGTHGTGTQYQSVSNMVLSMELVNGLGEIVTISEPTLLPAARLALGALGIITRVTLQLVDARDIRREETIMRLDLMRDHFFTKVQMNEHCIFCYF